MQGEGYYVFKKTGDAYNGSWFAGKKHGQGVYVFGADSSSMDGKWDNGQILSGTWIMPNYAVYTGEFNLGRPTGAGKFDFSNANLTQSGSYVESKRAEGEEEEEELGEGEPPRPPKVEWKGESLVAF
jgi:hypothetical protein